MILLPPCRRKVRLCSVVLVLLLFLVLPEYAAHASSGHYLNGLAGLKAATIPPPGSYWGFQSWYYSAGKVKNQGKTMDVNYSVDVFMFAPTFVHSSDFRIFGGRYAFAVLIPIVHTNFSVSKTFDIPLPNHLGVRNISVSRSGSKTGLSDVCITPLMLTWEKERYDITTGLDIFIPTGEYSSSNPASPGRGFWTMAPKLGATLYLDAEKTWTVSALAHYEFHTRQQGTNQTPGNHLHLEWGVGKTFAQIFKAGIVGYNSWQVTRDSGPGSRGRMTTANAIGTEAGVFIPGLNMDVTMRFFWEYKNRNNAQGKTATLSVMFPF